MIRIRRAAPLCALLALSLAPISAAQSQGNLTTFEARPLGGDLFLVLSYFPDDAAQICFARVGPADLDEIDRELGCVSNRFMATSDGVLDVPGVPPLRLRPGLPVAVLRFRVNEGERTFVRSYSINGAGRTALSNQVAVANLLLPSMPSLIEPVDVGPSMPTPEADPDVLQEGARRP